MKNIIIGVFGYILFEKYLLGVPASYTTLAFWGIGCLLGISLGEWVKEKRAKK